MILEVFFFFLPAAFANMAPVLFKWVPFLNYPVDMNKKFHHHPIFGKHKTDRGFFFGITLAILIVYLQSVYQTKYLLIDYSSIHIILLGFLLGFGALLGDLIKSFFKREAGIKEGKQWVPFDQLDWVVGALVFVSFYVSLSVEQAITALVIFGLLHPVINLIGYYLGIKKNKY